MFEWIDFLLLVSVLLVLLIRLIFDKLNNEKKTDEDLINLIDDDLLTPDDFDNLDEDKNKDKDKDKDKDK